MRILWYRAPYPAEGEILFHAWCKGKKGVFGSEFTLLTCMSFTHSLDHSLSQGCIFLSKILKCVKYLQYIFLSIRLSVCFFVCQILHMLLFKKSCPICAVIRPMITNKTSWTYSTPYSSLRISCHGYGIKVHVRVLLFAV